MRIAQAWRRAAILTAAALLALCPAVANAVELWFGPPDDLVRGKVVMVPDFRDLFRVDSGWPAGARAIKVFSINNAYAERGDEANLRMIDQFLRAHHIRLNVSLQSLPADDCGKGVEGIVQLKHVPGDVARRLKSFGISVDSFSLDSPLTYGNFYSGPRACKYPVPEIAQRIAGVVKDVRTSYPEVQFIDYEAATDVSLDQWQAVLQEWLDAYKADTGTELDGLALDANWRKPWREAARSTSAILRKHHVRSGIFLDAEGGPTVTDASWMAEAQRHAKEIKAIELDFDFIIVASWMMHPQRLLPETDRSSLTWLIQYYRSLR